MDLQLEYIRARRASCNQIKLFFCDNSYPTNQKLDLNASLTYFSDRLNVSQIKRKTGSYIIVIKDIKINMCIKAHREITLYGCGLSYL